MSERDGRPRIVAGVDGSPASLAALQWAVRQAAATGSTVQAVIAWQYPSVIGGYGWAPVALLESSACAEIAQKTLAGAIADVDFAGRDVPVISLVREGNAAQVLIDPAAARYAPPPAGQAAPASPPRPRRPAQPGGP